MTSQEAALAHRVPGERGFTDPPQTPRGGLRHVRTPRLRTTDSSAWNRPGSVRLGFDLVSRLHRLGISWPDAPPATSLGGTGITPTGHTTALEGGPSAEACRLPSHHTSLFNLGGERRAGRGGRGLPGAWPLRGRGEWGGAVPGRPACCYFLIAMDTATSSWSRSQASPRVTLTLYGAPTGFQVRLSWAQGPKAPSPLLGSVKQGDWQCLPLTTAHKRQVLREAREGS